MPAVPWAGRPPVLGLVARRGGGAASFSGVCSTGDGAPSLTLVPSLRQTPLSRKVHGVNAIGAPTESHAPRRRAGGVSHRTIRCMPSTWCQSPGEHVSDETAHTSSLSQRVPAVLQHCVRRFAVASNAALVAWINGSSAVRTPVSDPLERARVHAYATGNGATVGPARVGLSAPSNHWNSVW